MRTTTTHRQAGFTLIEILIVTTIIGIIAGITVPTLLSRKVAANEAAVIAIMRAISSAQFQLQASGELDLNTDGGFEYATFGELGAIDGLRGSGEFIANRLLSVPVTTVDAAGWATHHGFHFCLYLPDASGKGVVGVPANAGSIDPVKALSYWTCLAWPVEAGTTGIRTFFVNQQGQVPKFLKPGYSGSASVPPPGAGLVGVPADEIHSQNLAADTKGADGNHWVVVS